MPSIDDIVKSNFPNDKARLVANLVYTVGWINNIMNEALKPYGVSMQQYNILSILRGQGEWAKMSLVKERMIQDSPNATRMSDKLLKKGLIERKRGEEDRRVVYVRITLEGKKLLEELDKADNKLKEAMKERLTNKDAKEMSRILDAFRG